jgi:hypothetical protein
MDKNWIHIAVRIYKSPSYNWINSDPPETSSQASHMRPTSKGVFATSFTTQGAKLTHASRKRKLTLGSMRVGALM